MKYLEGREQGTKYRFMDELSIRVRKAAVGGRKGCLLGFWEIRLKLSFVSLEGRHGVREVPEVSHGEYFQKENV